MEYRCPKDDTASNKMELFYKGKPGLRDRTFPNEVLYCETCNTLYRWRQLKAVEVHI